MKYDKPVLIPVGNARALVLGARVGDGDTGGSADPTKPPFLVLGLDD